MKMKRTFDVVILALLSHFFVKVTIQSKWKGLSDIILTLSSQLKPARPSWSFLKVSIQWKWKGLSTSFWLCFHGTFRNLYCIFGCSLWKLNAPTVGEVLRGVGLPMPTLLQLYSVSWTTVGFQPNFQFNSTACSNCSILQGRQAYHKE